MTGKLAKPALDVGLVTAAAEPLLAFYRNAFGCEVQDPLTLPGIGVIHKLAVGESILRVMVPASPPAEAAPGESFSDRAGIRYLTFEVEDARAAYEAALASGGSSLIEPFELRPGRTVAQVVDPDGNTIEIGQG